MAAPMGQQPPSASGPPQNPAAAQAQAQKEAEVDPIIKIKQLLLPRLKESLVVSTVLKWVFAMFLFFYFFFVLCECLVISI
jgi:hypothetical protein